MILLSRVLSYVFLLALAYAGVAVAAMGA